MKKKKLVTKILAFMFIAMFSFSFLCNYSYINAYATNVDTPIEQENSSQQTEQNQQEQPTTQPTKPGGSVNDIKVEYETDADGNLILKSNLEENTVSSWNQIITKFKIQIIGISGLITLLFVGLLIFFFTKLGASGDNPQKRSGAITSIIFCVIGLALFGSVSLIMSISYFFLR